MREGLILTVSLALLCGQAGAEPFVQTLTSTSRNIYVDNWQATSRQLTPTCPVAWSVRKFVLHGGKQEGVDVIVLDNGKLQITIVPTRGLGILSVTMADVRLGWDSPVKEVVHPRHINLQSRGGLGWLEGFNEFMCRCGLESNGHPGTDKFVNNVGEEATMELTLHGKIANIPAQEVEVAVDQQPPYRIRRARVRNPLSHQLWPAASGGRRDARGRLRPDHALQCTCRKGDRQPRAVRRPDAGLYRTGLLHPAAR
jgi:hypothetical protein